MKSTTYTGDKKMKLKGKQHMEQKRDNELKELASLRCPYTYEDLTEDGIIIAKALGYDKEIKINHRIEICNRRFTVDIYATSKDGKTLAIECGNIPKDSGYGSNWYNRLFLLNLVCDKVLWLPFFHSKCPVFPGNDIEVLEKEIKELRDTRGQLYKQVYGLQEFIDVFSKFYGPFERVNEVLSKLKKNDYL